MSENLNDLRHEIQDLSIQKRRGLVVISKDVLFNSPEALLNCRNWRLTLALCYRFAVSLLIK